MILRKLKGKQFIYTQNDKHIKDSIIIDRIRKLAIPPAWTDVEIAPFPYHKIQVKGRDNKHRRQYLYSKKWTNTQEKDKFERLLVFVKTMPRIKRKLRTDFLIENFSKDKVIAGVFKLIFCLNIRAGNTIYAQKNKSYGICTLQKKHVSIKNKYIIFTFIGKSNITHTLKLTNKELISFIEVLMTFPGNNLFQYYWGNKYCKLRTKDLNIYIKQFDEKFTTKDIRTYSANYYFIKYIHFLNTDTIEKNIQKTITRIAEKLGNTKIVSKKSYILPYIVEQYRYNPKSFNETNIQKKLITLLERYNSE